MRRRRIIPVLVSSLLLTAASGPPSSATPTAALSLRRAVVRTDGNDTGGPLDLRSLRLVHLGPRFDRLSFSTWGPVTNTELKPGHRSDFAVGIDLNDATPVRYEYWIYVHVVDGRLGALLVRAGATKGVATPVARVGPKAFWVDVPWRAMGRPASYRFALYSFYPAKPCAGPHAACVDKIPNRLPLIVQDLTPPTVHWLMPSSGAPVVSTALTYPARFSVRDDPHGSGVGRWQVQTQAVGASTWTRLKEGTTTAPTVPVSGGQGQTYHVRIVATDRAGNTSVSTSRTIIVPIDDRNGGVIYDGSWTPVSDAPAFLGTTSSSSVPGDSATLEFVGGSQVCVLGMPVAAGASATVAIDSVVQADAASEDPDTPDQGALQCYPLSGGSAAPHSLAVTVSTGPDAFVLDGFEVAP